MRAADVQVDAAARHVLRAPPGHRGGRGRLQLHGAPSVRQALAAAGVAAAVGMPRRRSPPALAAAVPVQCRPAAGHRVVAWGDRHRRLLQRQPGVDAGGVALVDLAAGSDVARRTLAVLGEMRELGASSVTEHAEMGRLAVRWASTGWSSSVTAARAIYQGALDAGSERRRCSCPMSAGAIELVRAQVRAGDVVLVKASRSVGLERVAAACWGRGRIVKLVIFGGGCRGRGPARHPAADQVPARSRLFPVDPRVHRGQPYPEHRASGALPRWAALAIVAAVVSGTSVPTSSAWDGPPPPGLLALYLMVGLGAGGPGR